MRLDARRSLSLALAALALFGATGCPPDPVDPIPQTPPQISVAVAKTNVVGSEVPFTVHISGCDRVTQLDIFDRLVYLKTIPATMPTTEGTLLPNELDYTKGLALPIALNAKVTCADGRTATSRTQALTFLPAERVVTLPNDEQVVTDLFTAEGSGDDTTFIGCFILPDGFTAVARVNQAGAVIDQSIQIPGFTCTHNTVFTDKHPVTKKRWIYDVDGAVAMDENLNFSGAYDQDVSTILVASNGDAIVVSTDPFTVTRVRHEAPGAPVWSTYAVASLIGRPALNSAELFVPVEGYDAAETNDPDHISIMRLDLATGTIAGHVLLLTDTLDTVPFSSWDHFSVTMSDDGTQVYVPRLIDDRYATVRACPAITDGCAQPLWQSPPLDEYPSLLLPYNNGSRMAVISSRRANFLNIAQNGVPFGEFLFPQGDAQFFTQAIPSKGEAFFLLSSSVNAQGAFNLPAEIIALDSAANGELFRYQAPAGSVAMSFDDAGHPWMRVGTSLVKPFPLADYRAALLSGEAPGGN